MKLHILSTLMSALLTSTATAAAESPMPGTWYEFKTSKNPVDRQLVAEIDRLPWFERCVAWGNSTRANEQSRRTIAYREALLSENIINGMDLGRARPREIAVGMSACGVFAAFGKPDDVNTSTNAHRTQQQLIYRSRRLYIYTDSTAGDHNGTVTSFQH